MKIYDYLTSGGKDLIDDYFEGLPDSVINDYHDVRKLILEKGYDAFLMLNTRQLDGKLWEIKISQERIMYVIADFDSVYFLHACKKQKGKAELKNIRLAKSRAKREGLL